VKTICKVEGCGNPRMVSKSGHVLTMCDDHQRAAWREAARAKTGSKRRPVPPSEPVVTQSPVVCRMCGCTAQQAAFAALHNDSWCYYCTWVDTSPAELRRRLAQPDERPELPPLEKRTLLVEADRLQIASLLIMSDEPIQSDAQVTQCLADADQAGTLVLRRVEAWEL
jgi:hypothetical protein